MLVTQCTVQAQGHVSLCLYATLVILLRYPHAWGHTAYFSAICSAISAVYSVGHPHPDLAKHTMPCKVTYKRLSHLSIQTCICCRIASKAMLHLLCNFLSDTSTVVYVTIDTYDSAAILVCVVYHWIHQQHAQAHEYLHLTSANIQSWNYCSPVHMLSTY